MKVEVKVTNKSVAVLTRYKAGALSGLDAAANLIQREITKAFGSDYYKGGAFRSTLQVKQSIRRTILRDGHGLTAFVGTKLLEALYWELGHPNIFTRKFERVRIWVPTAQAQADNARQEFAKIVARVMGAA